MKTRASILRKIKTNLKKIEDLNKKNRELAKENCLFSDKRQQFTEEIEIHKIKKEGKRVDTEVLVGRVHWKEYFRDEDNPKRRPICIERSQIVRLNGVWQ